MVQVVSEVQEILPSQVVYARIDLQVAMVPSPQQVPPSQAVSVRIGW